MNHTQQNIIKNPHMDVSFPNGEAMRAAAARIFRVFLFTLLLTINFLIFTTPASADITTGLVGHWTFNGKDTVWTSATAATTLDKSGLGNTGTLTNMHQSTSTVAGKIGQGLRMSSRQYIVINDNASLNVSTNFTLSTWVKLDTLGASKAIYDSATGGTNRWLVDISSNNKFTFTERGIADNEATTALSTGVWYHLVVVKSGDSGANIRFYLNGVSDGTASVGSVEIPTSDKRIGNWTEGTNLPLMGLMDDLRIYNRALSENDVRQLYNEGLAKVAVSPVNSLKSGLVGHWTLDGKDTIWTSATAATTLDKSGQGNTGTLTNMTQVTAPVAGKIGQGLKFDGINDYVDMGTMGNFGSSLESHETTVAVWIKTTNTATAVIMGTGNTGNATVIQVNINRNFDDGTNQVGYIYGRLRDESNNSRVVQASFNTGITDGKWHHVVVVLRPTAQGSIYVDGVEVTTTHPRTVNISNPANFTFPLTFGALNWKGSIGTDGWYKGIADEFRIYEIGLSSFQISTLYYLGLSKLGISPVNSLKTGLVAHWTLDGKDTPWTSSTAATTLDKSGQGNTGTLTNMQLTSSPILGKIGQGLFFDKIDDYVVVSSFSSQVSSAPGLSMSLWVKPGATLGTNSGLSGIRNNTTADFYLLLLNSGKIEARFRNSGGTAYTLSSAPWTESKWVFLSFVYDGSSIYLYVDGVLKESLAASGSLANSVDLEIGRVWTGTTYRYFQGIVDDFKFYKRALSASEVTKLYNLGLGKTR